MKNINIDKIYSILKKESHKYKAPVIDFIQIQTNDPFKILVSTMLSARTKDSVTAKASMQLFTKVKKLIDLEKISQKDIETLIYPVGFYKVKAKHLKELPKILKQKFNNKIPDNVDKLLELPGVGRKTANLVVALGFKKLAICVDTHVHRIMNRIGYVKTKNSLQTERVLRKKLPKKYWIKINSLLVGYGQNICTPISPKCSKCKIIKYCNQINVTTMR
ncbi:MAG: endonuclease III [Candidatus Woesearchaeota archaeon]